MLSPDEYYAAVTDEDLSDATIKSEDDVTLDGSPNSLADKLAELDPSSKLNCLLGMTTSMANRQDSEVVAFQSGACLGRTVQYSPRHPLAADHS